MYGDVQGIVILFESCIFVEGVGGFAGARVGLMFPGVLIF